MNNDFITLFLGQVDMESEKGKRENLENYRPISLTSVFTKLME